MRQLWKDLAYLRRGRRNVHQQLQAEWKEEDRWRVRWWYRAGLWVLPVVAVCLIIFGDKTERGFGIAMLIGPAVIVGFAVWVYWKALRTLRRERRSAAS